MYVTLTFKVVWQFKEAKHYKVTRCKKVINTKTGKMLRYNSRGFYINGRYLKRREINNFLEKIERKTETPF